ncbi:MAG: hypothetical protein CME63_17355 [Halobacteriovoraceae bacterium]|nr:hypothetical protein [Halobacteriovoraceae bacterium]|tara:strand:- start:194831 stop:195910 length:1080 start_codon:yes stop_codon:yes gene_type:complete
MSKTDHLTPSPNKKDYSAIKFQVSEALGEWMNCLFLKWDNSGNCHYEFIHHANGDGASSYTKMLEKEGSTVPTVPTQKKNLKASFIRKFFLLRKFLKKTKAVSIHWSRPRKDTTGIPSSFFTLRLSVHQTELINRLCKEKKMGLNSLLLWGLDQATSSLLLTENSERKWVCPINMRVYQNQRYGNHSASIIVNAVDPADRIRPQFFQDEIRSFLKSGLHWGSQIYSNMARYIGFKGTLFMAKRIKELGTGVFSNMGEWPGADVLLSEKSEQITHRIFVTPSTQVLPVAAGALTWKGALTLSLQLHPSLQRTDREVKELFQLWWENIQKPLGTPIESPIEIEKAKWESFAEAPRHLIIDT